MRHLCASDIYKIRTRSVEFWLAERKQKPKHGEHFLDVLVFIVARYALFKLHFNTNSNTFTFCGKFCLRSESLLLLWFFHMQTNRVLSLTQLTRATPPHQTHRSHFTLLNFPFLLTHICIFLCSGFNTLYLFYRYRATHYSLLSINAKNQQQIFWLFSKLCFYVLN